MGLVGLMFLVQHCWRVSAPPPKKNQPTTAARSFPKHDHSSQLTAAAHVLYIEFIDSGKHNLSNENRTRLHSTQSWARGGYFSYPSYIWGQRRRNWFFRWDWHSMRGDIRKPKYFPFLSRVCCCGRKYLLQMFGRELTPRARTKNVVRKLANV